MRKTLFVYKKLKVQDIEKLRSEIDQIHVDLARLFRQRLHLTKKIWALKKSKNIPLIDSAREDHIIHRFDHDILQTAEKTAVQNLFRNILSETKKYLEVKPD